MPISWYKSNFLHFMLGVEPCFLVLEGQLTPKRYTERSYSAGHFLGRPRRFISLKLQHKPNLLVDPKRTGIVVNNN